MNKITEEFYENNYYADPYCKHEPEVSILVLCRMTRGIGGPVDILRFLTSIKEYWRPYDQEKTEILIKFDRDDLVAVNEFFKKQHLSEKFGLHIRQFIYGRWEGKKSFNYHYQFLFSHRNPKTKLIMFGTDDSYFNFDPLEEGVNAYLASHTDKFNNYSIYVTRNNIDNALKSIESIEKDHWKWANGDLTEPFPIVSSKIIEICGGMGWQTNIDNWLSLLNAILYKKYNVSLYRELHRPNFIRRITDERPGLEPARYSNFNKELFVDDTNAPQYSYYYKLVEQQADNIYLNMKKDGII